MGELTLEQRECVAEILAAVRPVATEFYRLIGKPLGVTGEIAELLGLTLVDTNATGYDATRPDSGRSRPRESMSRRAPTRPDGTWDSA